MSLNYCQFPIPYLGLFEVHEHMLHLAVYVFLASSPEIQRKKEQNLTVTECVKKGMLKYYNDTILITCVAGIRT